MTGVDKAVETAAAAERAADLCEKTETAMKRIATMEKATIE